MNFSWVPTGGLLRRTTALVAHRVESWWSTFECGLRDIGARLSRSGSGTPYDAEILAAMENDHRRCFSGTQKGDFANGDLVARIRVLALEYGKNKTPHFSVQITNSMDPQGVSQMIRTRKRPAQDDIGTTTTGGNDGSAEGAQGPGGATASSGAGTATALTAAAAVAAAAGNATPDTTE